MCTQHWILWLLFAHSMSATTRTSRKGEHHSYCRLTFAGTPWGQHACSQDLSSILYSLYSLFKIFMQHNHFAHTHTYIYIHTWSLCIFIISYGPVRYRLKTGCSFLRVHPFFVSFTLVGLVHSFPTGFRVHPLLPLAFGIRRISLVFCGLLINRWCPSTLKILGFWFGYCCSLTFRGRYFLTGFLRFTHKPVVSQHPKNPGFLALVIAPHWFSGDAFSLLVFCSLPINWVVSQHPKNPGFWFSAVYR